MARATVNVQRIGVKGTKNPTYDVIGVDGVEFKNNGKQIAHIVTPTAAAITITTPATVNGDLAIDDRSFSMGIDDELFVGGFSKQYYNTEDGMVQIDSDQTDTTIAVYQV